MDFDTTKQEFNILFPKIVHIDSCMYSKELKICKHNNPIIFISEFLE